MLQLQQDLDAPAQGRWSLNAPARLLLRGVFALGLLAAGVLPCAAAEPSDPRAIEIAAKVMKALGGDERWNAVAGIRWSFGSSLNDSVRSVRRHAWDRRTGRHRVEGVTRTGASYVYVHTVGDTTTGRAWMNGREIVGDSLQALLTRAEAMWINDSYWLLMPYKLRDPGVTLKWDGEHAEGTEKYDRLALTFTNVGLTPGDRYWVFVNRSNHRVERWDMQLEGNPPPANTWTVEGWQKHDGLAFATAHRQKAMNVFTNGIEIVKDFPAGTFDAP